MQLEKKPILNETVRKIKKHNAVTIKRKKKLNETVEISKIISIKLVNN